MTALYCLIPAAGVGTRMGAELPKQYLQVAGKPLVLHVLETFAAATDIAQVFVVVTDGDPVIAALIAAAPALAARVSVLPAGGATRRDTVFNGLNLMRATVADDDWVLVHDAARPGLTPTLLAHLIGTLRDDAVGGLLALPMVDTVKRADAQGRSSATVPRDGLWMAQTPQMFRYGLLRRALQQEAAFTDEASAVEALGLKPKLVAGDARNFKLTLPADLALAELFMAPAEGKHQMNDMLPFRIGQGYDCHALVPSRKLIIGGVTIEHPTGLLGHSDADVLLHAITDALFGAAALGDIGRHFSDTDPQFSGADSRVLLREAAKRVRQAGYRIGNVDATIIAQAPKMAPHIASMVAHIAADLELAPGQVNVKAKTNEKMGFLGREEGIAAEAVVLLIASGPAES